MAELLGDEFLSLGDVSVALGWAEVLGAADLFCGVNAVDYSGYPDCRPEFIAAFEEMVGPVLSGEERGEVDTLGGLIFSLAGRIPERGEVIRHPSGCEFEIVDVDPRRIRRLRVRLPQPASTSSTAMAPESG